MFLETLREEHEGAHLGDELMRQLNDIAERRSSVDRSNDTKSPIGKTEKDKLNTKEQTTYRTRRFSEKEALQCRASSLKRAMHNIMEQSDIINSRKKRYSIQVDNLGVLTSSSSENSPWTSPVPPINIISPSVSTTKLTCISPLPDLRRDSMDEYFFNSLNLPVPKQFADDSSRRGSGLPESIREENELLFPLCKQQDNKKSDSKATNNINVDNDNKFNICRLDYLAVSSSTVDETEQKNNECGLMPAEVYERNLLRNQQNIDSINSSNATKHSESSNTLQLPAAIVPVLEIERPPSTDNIYVSDTITLIDTDAPVI